VLELRRRVKKIQDQKDKDKRARDLREHLRLMDDMLEKLGSAIKAGLDQIEERLSEMSEVGDIYFKLKDSNSEDLSVLNTNEKKRLKDYFAKRDIDIGLINPALVEGVLRKELAKDYVRNRNDLAVVKAGLNAQQDLADEYNRVSAESGLSTKRVSDVDRKTYTEHDKANETFNKKFGFTPEEILDAEAEVTLEGGEVLDFEAMLQAMEKTAPDGEQVSYGSAVP
jgi:hypothetical protein